MSVCGQLGTGAGSLLDGPPVHRARPLSVPRSESCHFRNGDGNWSKPALASRRTGNALKYKWGWIFIFLRLSSSRPDSPKKCWVLIYMSVRLGSPSELGADACPLMRPWLHLLLFSGSFSPRSWGHLLRWESLTLDAFPFVAFLPAKWERERWERSGERGV